MHITILTIGSRGDVQPFVALGKGLQDAGYTVRIATHAVYADFVRGHGLDFAKVEPNPLELLNSEMGQSWLGSNENTLRFLNETRKIGESFMEDVTRDALAACRGSDLIIFSILAVIGYHIAEYLNVPCVSAKLTPLRPTRAFTMPMVPSPPDAIAPLYNRVTSELIFQGMSRSSRRVINQWRVNDLDLPPMPLLRPYGERWLNTPEMYGISPALLPKPDDWAEHVEVVGYWFLDRDPDWSPPDDLVAFLDAGSPPVYVGFGSMNRHDTDPRQRSRMVLDALARAEQRGILLTGWGALAKDDLPDYAFAVDNVPHDWLFPRMAAVVHHGGAGTTAAGVRAGVPALVLPFFADQPFWGDLVHRHGVAPKPIKQSDLTTDNLTDAIRTLTTDTAMKDRAAALGEKVRAEDGVATAIAFLRRWVNSA